MSEFKIGSLSAKGGTKASGFVTVCTGSDGNPVSIPTIILKGKDAGPILLVDACTHGDEVEGSLSVIRIVESVDVSSLRGTLVAVPVLHTAAYEASARGNPLERWYYDLNRSYPGKANGSMTQILADYYFNNYASKANYVISLHGGGNIFYLSPYVIAESEKCLELVKGMAWEKFTYNPDINIASGLRNTLQQACADRGIPAITCECGGATDRTPDSIEDTVSKFKTGVLNTMVRLKMLPGSPIKPKISLIRKSNLRARSGGLIFYEKSFRLGHSVSKDELLMTIKNPIGETLERIDAPIDGFVMGLPASPMSYPGSILGSVYNDLETIDS